jgi:hypothetical protein
MISISRSRFTATTLLGSLVLFGAATALWAQSSVATIQGTVQDSSSAAIPSANVQALNQATGVSL